VPRSADPPIVAGPSAARAILHDPVPTELAPDAPIRGNTTAAPPGAMRSRDDDLAPGASGRGSTAVGFDLTGEATPLRVMARDLLASRQLLVMLSRKDFFVRYRRASFGVIWAVALPLFQAVVMAVVFSRVIKIHTGTNYPTFVYSGLLSWTFFASAIPGASTSVVDGQDIATKIYFPRAILPLVSIGSNVYGFIPGLVILLGFALVGHVSLGLNWLLLLPATVVMVTLTAGFSLVLAAVHVYFRDVRYVVQAALTAWLYLTPVLYPLRKAPGFLRHLIELLPTTGMVELFRAGSVGADPGWLSSLAVTGVWIVGLMGVAAVLYRRFDRVFVDLL
jgi:lipopolysaccharide transport system permease protein